MNVHRWADSFSADRPEYFHEKMYRRIVTLGSPPLWNVDFKHTAFHHRLTR